MKNSEEKMLNNADFDELAVDYLTGNLRGSRARAFLDMIDSDEECAERFDRLNRLYASSMAPHYEADRERNWKLLRRRIGKHGFGFRVPRWFYAAAVLAVGVLSGVAAAVLMNNNGLFSSADSALCEVVVPDGSRTSIVLPDSTIVWLNSGSRMTYPRSFGRKSRKVSLAGEGYFEVRRDEKRPFTVSTDALDVKVLGTKFNVLAYEEDPCLSVDLLKGAVEVSAETGAVLRLSPGQRATLDRSTGNLISGESAPFVSDWVNGRMSFSNTPVTEILERLQRHFNVKIKVLDHRLSEEHFSGSIDLSMSLDEILEYLDVDGKYSVTMNDGVIYISEKTR